MNLHIVPDNTFINKFYDNLEELGLTSQNKIVVRSNKKNLKSIRHALPFAPLYSSRFSSMVGDTAQYEKVFIHYFTPLLYRWIARHQFKELNWMIWGGDLYNLPALDNLCYDPITLDQYVKKDWSAKTLLYKLKLAVTQDPFKRKAYSKVKNILTWMNQEYRFALDHLPVKANHKFFFYENQMPYGKLDTLIQPAKSTKTPTLIIGNSASPTNNHADVVEFLETNRVRADLLIPVSYGDQRYISFLKKKLKFSYGKIEFIDRYMQFEEYLNFLAAADGLVMNTIRPQGYGNILMMMYIGKPVFFHEQNISLLDLDRSGLKWFPIHQLTSHLTLDLKISNKEAVLNLLSHDQLLKQYVQLFNVPSPQS